MKKNYEILFHQSAAIQNLFLTEKQTFGSILYSADRLNEFDKLTITVSSAASVEFCCSSLILFRFGTIGVVSKTFLVGD